MSSRIRNYYTRVAYSPSQGQNIYELSGEELTQWTGDYAATTQDGLIHPFTGYSGIGCSEIIYFWQEDPSNSGHDFHLSDSVDGFHGGGWTDYTLDSAAGFTESGEMGTPGACARLDLEQYVAFQMDPSSIAFTWVYPFCWNHPGMGLSASPSLGVDNVFECFPVLTECPSGSSVVDCNLSSGMSGALDSVSGDANAALDLVYGSYDILSGSYTTGVETGLFPLCTVVGTGSSSAAANNRTYDLAQLFYYSGICTDDTTKSTSYMVVSGINMSFGAARTGEIAPNVYAHWSTGYADRRHYVTYTPTVSGNKTVANVSTYCPDTELQVTIDRDRTIHTLSTYVAILSGAIHSVDVTLPVACGGYTTSLTASCPKFNGGMELYGEKSFTQGNEACWSDYFETGVYRLEHIHGSFLATDGKHTLGSGTLTAKTYV